MAIEDYLNPEDAYCYYEHANGDRTYTFARVLDSLNYDIIVNVIVCKCLLQDTEFTDAVIASMGRRALDFLGVRHAAQYN